MRQVSNRTIQRFSIAALVLVLIYLVVISVVNTNQTHDILRDSTVSEQLAEQRDQLDDQDELIEQAITEIEELGLQLNTASLQIGVLLDQLEELGVQPRIDPTTVPVPGPRGPTGPAGAPAPTTTTTVPGNNNPPDPEEKEKKEKDK